MAETSEASRRIERHVAQLQREPGSRVFAQLADAYRREGLLDEAIRICREGLEVHPTYVVARVVLGRALLERGELTEAEKELRHALAETPDNLLAMRLAGDALSRQGRVLEARQFYQRALDLNPMDREVRDRLVDVDTHPPSPSPQPAPETEDRATDPLATPTLASLYASQGYGEVAELIYARMRHRPGARHGMSPEPVVGVGETGLGLEGRLLAMRLAAHKLREARGRAPRGGEQENTG